MIFKYYFAKSAIRKGTSYGVVHYIQFKFTYRIVTTKLTRYTIQSVINCKAILSFLKPDKTPESRKIN